MPNKYGVYGCDIEENEVVVLEMGTVIYLLYSDNGNKKQNNEPKNN